MNKERSILCALTYIIVCIACLSLCQKVKDLRAENESLKGKIEMQQSVIADLEENLKDK